jgi:cytochrome c oxidase assembly protein subunit 11
MKNSINKSAIKLSLIALAMFGFGYLLVPLYDVLCDITGLNGKSQNVTQQQQANFVVDESRTITVEFITTLNQGMPWDFEAATTKMQVYPGKPYNASFFVKNKTNRSIIGQAIPSIAPNVAANHFIKTECFCFNNQLLEAGQSMEMPVVFVINPALPDRIKTVTLSYTYFDVSNTVSKPLNNIDNT